MRLFERLFATKRSPELTGAPVRRRLKTYQAESGYVYQYVYLGKREEGSGARFLEAYVFEASADRKTWFQTAILLRRSALSPWQAEQGRELAAPERYAVAKIALMRVMDELDAPGLLREPAEVTPAMAREILRQLDL